MNNPLRHPEQINPRIATDVQAAFEKNRDAGRVIDDFADTIASSGLADIVKAETDEAKADGPIESSRIDRVNNPEAKQNFKDAFTESEQLFARLNLTPPAPDKFVAAGVDFVNLADRYVEMKQNGLRPTLILTPSLPIVSWQNLYQVLTADSAIPNNPLEQKDGGNGLWLNRDVNENTRELLKSELEYIKSNPMHDIYTDETGPLAKIPWTIALLPTVKTPEGLSTPHDSWEWPNDSSHSLLPTISLYLTLQAVRIQAGLSPLDNGTSTWLHGSFRGSDGSGNPLALSPIAHFNKGRVIILRRRGDHADQTIGARLPTWG